MSADISASMLFTPAAGFEISVGQRAPRLTTGVNNSLTLSVEYRLLRQILIIETLQSKFLQAIYTDAEAPKILNQTHAL